MQYKTVSEARGIIPSLADGPEGTVLTHNGQPVAVLLPIREYRAMRAMLKLIAQPALAERVVAAHQRVQQGDLDGFVEHEAEHGAAAVRENSL